MIATKEQALAGPRYEGSGLKTPPLLMVALLLFWGWQCGLLLPGLLLAIIIEGSRLIRARWEFNQEDFDRVYKLTTVLFVGAFIYAFASQEGTNAVNELLENTSAATRSAALSKTTKSVMVLFQWLPMVFAPIMGAQVYGNREKMDFSRSGWLPSRLNKLREGERSLFGRGINVSYVYFGICLFSASAANEHPMYFFPAMVGFLGWGLWPHRSRRYSRWTWGAMLFVVVGLGIGACMGLNHAQRFIENLDTMLLSRFGRQTIETKVRTSIGSIGNLKLSNKIIYRLETDRQAPPEYLREASYSLFRSPLWYVGRRDFSSTQPETETSWRLLPKKASKRSVTISGLLPHGRGFLALPLGTSQLEDLPVYALETNRMGIVHVREGPGFLSFEAKYDKGASLDAPPEEEDKDIPLNEKPAVDQVAAKLELRNGQSAREVMKKLEKFFQSNFQYSTWLGREHLANSNETALGKFLLKNKKGHCEYFATATVFLLRAEGIPARYAIGYAVQEASGTEHIVRERHAHAWTLVFYDGAWHDFDTTPASWVELEASRAHSYWQGLRDGWSKIWFQFNKWRWSRNSLREYVLWGLLVVLIIILSRMFWKKRVVRLGGSKKTGRSSPVWPGKDSEFYLLEKRLAKTGLERRPAENISAWLERVGGKLPGSKGRLRELWSLHYRLRFDPAGLDPQGRSVLREGVKALIEQHKNARN
ncbi:MAG TPA: transglutaminase domain-containing protein [Candidatus Saccharimonadales bacterium]|nr:transglutaminase domain-containing protein [Candidatus Saccharimonadales bacterium]